MYPAVEKDASLSWIHISRKCNAGHPPRMGS